MSVITENPQSLCP